MRPGGLCVIWSAAHDQALHDAMAEVFGDAEATAYDVDLQGRAEQYWLHLRAGTFDGVNDSPAEYRIEHDSMGEVRVPRDALWRAQTQRAVENFPISGQPLEPALIHALAHIKAAAAHTNAALGSLTTEQADAITEATAQIVDGEHDDQFPIDVFQTGSGTSTNMNVNEVIATLAQQQGVEVHPNDHVNAAQSSNDTFPSAIHVAAVLGTRDLLDGIARLHDVADGQERRVRRRREVRPHAPDGRHAGDARPGAGRVRRRRRPRPRARRGRPPPRARASAGWNRRRHRHQRAAPGSPSRRSPGSTRPPASSSPRPATTSRPRAAATRSSS